MAHNLSTPPVPSWLITVLVAGSISMIHPSSLYPSPLPSPVAATSSHTMMWLLGVTVPAQNARTKPRSGEGKATLPLLLTVHNLLVLLKETDRMAHSAGSVSLLMDR